MKILGLLLIVAGIILGLYCGLWWAFIGGILQIIQEVRAENMQTSVVAFGILKVLFAGVIGWASAAVCLLPGFAMMNGR